MLKTVFIIFIVGFTMESLCASARTHGSTQIPSGTHQCTTAQFTCDNRVCIPLTWRCDGDIDCADRSDEENCSGSLTTVSQSIYDPTHITSDPDPDQCTTAEFMCDNRACIPLAWRCDGDSDCTDRSDEENCRGSLTTVSQSIYGSTQIPSGSHQCTTAQFTCDNRACIPLTWRCDGDFDCADRSDEENCRDNGSCESHQFRCTTSDNCIPQNWICDGGVDCHDGSDEVECDTPTSSASTILTTTPFLTSDTPTSSASTIILTTTPFLTSDTPTSSASTILTTTPFLTSDTPTSSASTILTTTPFPAAPSSSSASTWQQSTTSTSTPLVEISTKLNEAHALKTEKDISGSEQRTSASHVQTEKEDKEYGYLDKINTMVAVIVGGVVMTAIVISVAVVLVLVLTKRRTAKSEEHYDMPNVNQSCNANNENETNVRSSNLYDFIPDPGDCSASNYTSLECSAAKEHDYLTPEIETKEAPYVTIP